MEGLAPGVDTAPSAAQAPAPSREEALRDYDLGWQSRHASLIGRREVMTGKAKFGIFGDGKEVAQIALAKVFEKGDFRAGYYRDQTLMMALGLLSLEEFFAQLYADPDPEREPASAGRQMNCHFATRLVEQDGSWRDLTELYNSSADLSPLAAQMPRLVGLGYASRLYRELEELRALGGFSRGGREIAFGSIGNASCAEGPFWESVNAIGVLRASVLLSIWDDGYGISVPNPEQLAGGDVSRLLAGFARPAGSAEGFDLWRVKGWDYPELVRTYREAAAGVRDLKVPAIVHVTELTQPQGHSTSGSHERYKPRERLAWERDHDCLTQMRAWLLEAGHACETELGEREAAARARVEEAQRCAWQRFVGPLVEERDTVLGLLGAMGSALEEGSPGRARLEEIARGLRRVSPPLRRHTQAALEEALLVSRDRDSEPRRRLLGWKRDQEPRHHERYSSHLVSEGPGSALEVKPVPPRYEQGAASLNGFEVLNRAFDAALARHPELIAFGEDVGRLGDVNQGFAGLQAKYGPLRVSDTGIRECTILGQAIGMALRGLRPLAEIQYLDYILYGLQILSDDLATLRYRTRGAQKAPVIVRTRGHRLEGIWHSGSLLAGLLGLLRGMYLCVPRDMTRAAGMYNTLLASDDSAVVVEVLNGYRHKEPLPANLAELRVPLGVPERLRPGRDVTLLTYGACCRIALKAAERLAGLGVEVEVWDAQTLLPFDRPGLVGASLQRTNRLVIVDEDVPGGTTAYLMQQVLEEQHGYEWLDGEPRTVPGKPHRPAYGSDGDYWSKPGVEQVFRAVWELMHEASPARFPIFYR